MGFTVRQIHKEVCRWLIVVHLQCKSIQTAICFAEQKLKHLRPWSCNTPDAVEVCLYLLLLNQAGNANSKFSPLGDMHQFVLSKNSLLQVTRTHTAAWLLPVHYLPDQHVCGKSIWQPSLNPAAGMKRSKSIYTVLPQWRMGRHPSPWEELLHELCLGIGLWNEPHTPAL